MIEFTFMTWPRIHGHDLAPNSCSSPGTEFTFITWHRIHVHDL